MRGVCALWVLGVAVSFGGGRAAACTTCNCGDTTLTATGVERPYANRVRVAVEERYAWFSMGSDGVGEHVQLLRSTLAASWSPHRRVTVAMVLPWVTSFIDSGTRPRAQVNGLGDLELSLRGVVFQERGFAPHHLLWVAGGLKTPTGYRTVDSNGFYVSDDDQPGSGSWDPFAGLSYAWFSGDVISVFASTSARLTTDGWHGYRRGSWIGTSAVVQLQPWRWGAIQLGLDGIWQQSDTLPNHATMPNTGGTVGYVGFGFMSNPWRELLLRIYADAPVLTVMHGVQSVGPQFILQIAYDFN